MFAITKRPTDPMLDLLYRLEQRMGRVLEPFRTFDWEVGEPSTAWVPPVDIVEEPEVMKITAEIPGVKPEDVKLTVTDNLLTLSGTKLQVKEVKTEKVHRFERNYGTFERTFTLPATVDGRKIKATYGEGLLTITLPKVEAAKPQTVSIEVVPVQKALK